MLNKEVLIGSLEVNLLNKTVSIALNTIIKENGIEISQSRHRCAFGPGDIEQVKEYIGSTEGPEIDYLNAIWTQDVIDAYNNSIQD